MRQFAAWAHTAIGHEGAAAAQQLVALDDEHDIIEAGFGWRPVGEVDADVRAMTGRLANR